MSRFTTSALRTPNDSGESASSNGSRGFDSTARSHGIELVGEPGLGRAEVALEEALDRGCEFLDQVVGHRRAVMASAYLLVGRSRHRRRSVDAELTEQAGLGHLARADRDVPRTPAVGVEQRVVALVEGHEDARVHRTLGEYALAHLRVHEAGSSRLSARSRSRRRTALSACARRARRSRRRCRAPPFPDGSAAAAGSRADFVRDRVVPADRACACDSCGRHLVAAVRRAQVRERRQVVLGALRGLVGRAARESLVDDADRAVGRVRRVDRAGTSRPRSPSTRS